MSYSSIGTIVGTVVGAYFGYPQLGAVVGGMIGGQADLAAIPTSRLDDREAQRINFGSPIPRTYGHPRLGCTIIWCSDAIPNGVIGSAKGGDGGGQETYIRHMIVLLDERDNGFPARWWATGKLVQNRLSSASDETIDASVEESIIKELVYHSGGPSQLAFSTYASIVGDDYAIAYRGSGTAFLTVDCGTSGQLPPMTYELAGKGDGSNSGRTTRIKEDWAEADYRGDPPEGASKGGLSVIGLSGSGIATYRDNDSTAVDTIPEGIPFSTPAQGNGDIALAVWGTSDGICRFAWAGSGHSVLIDSENIYDYTGATELRFSTYQGEIALASSLPYETGIGLYTECEGTQGVVYIHALNGDHVYTHTFYPTVAKAESLALNDTTLWVFDGTDVYEYSREDYLLDATIPAPTGSGHRIFISQEGALCIANAEAQVFRWEQGLVDMEWTLVATLDDAIDEDENPIPAEYLGTDNAHHMIRAGSVFAVVTKEKELEGVPETFKYYIQPGWSGGSLDKDFGYNSIGEIASRFAYIDGSSFGGVPCGWAFSFEWGGGVHRRAARFEGWEIIDVYPFVGGPPELEPIMTYELQFNASRYYGYPGDSGQPPGFYETSTSLTIYEPTVTVTDVSLKKYVDVYRKRVDIETYDLSEPTLQEVVEDLSYRAGLEELQVDAEELATKDVHAIAVTQVGPTSAALELLMSTYRFFCVESEGKLKFKFLGSESLRTIPYEDLGATFGEAPANPFPLTRGSELELPSMESVRYSNISNDYQDGLESSDRLLQSIQSSRTSEYAIGLYPDEAKQIAVISQQVAQAGLVRVGPFNLGPEHRDLEPGDVITVVMRDGGSIQVLMTRVRYDRGVIEVEGVSYDAAAYLSDATTANNYTPAVTVRRPPDTEALIFDPPLLNDSLDGPKFAVVAKPSRYPWPGYSFQRSPDNNTYSEIYQDSSIGVFGTCSTILPVWTGGHVVDWISTVTVSVAPGELSSITRSELLSSRLNLCMVGDELLQFQRAELVSAGVYILSDFIRYLSGTEWVVHGPGEDFILIEPAKISSVGLNLADRGVSRFYKAVTLGRSIDTADPMEFTPDLVSMKPLAPANTRAILLPNGDILIRWERRSRYQTNVFRGVVPLGESSEAYSVDVYEDDVLLRTINAITTEATYTAAQQTADGVASAGVRFDIRQVGQVEGYPAELEI